MNMTDGFEDSFVVYWCTLPLNVMSIKCKRPSDSFMTHCVLSSNYIYIFTSINQLINHSIRIY